MNKPLEPNQAPKPPSSNRKRPRTLLDILFFSWANNVWFGITMLFLIFVYSSLGSAIPPLRQHPFFDMTEMEWFHWWPFDLMIALVCVTLTVVTLKQIPPRWVNAGVWTIHTGILILVLGSVYYFGAKVEGDVPIFRRQAVINVPGHAPTSLLIRPQNHITIGEGRETYHFTVSQVFPDWSIASDEDEGKTAYMAWIDVTTPTQHYTRQLLAGYPQYTEDILPDRSRAKKTLGKPLVDESLSMTLDYEPQDTFFIQNTAAIYARELGAEEWNERAIHDLPKYTDHIASHDDVFLAPIDEEMALRPLNLNVPAKVDNDPLSDFDVSVNAYLRYAFPASRWIAGGEKLNPVAKIALTSAPDARLDYELVAFDPRRSFAEQGQIAFRWVNSTQERDRLADPADGKIIIKVADVEKPVVTDLSDVWPPKSPEPEFAPIGDSGYAWRLKSVLHDLVMQSGEQAGTTMSVATIEVKTPEKTLTRFVANVPDASRDLGDDGKMTAPDPAIDTQFLTSGGGLSARVTLVSGPDDVGSNLVFKEPDGAVRTLPIAEGQTISLSPGVNATLIRLMTHGIEETKPRRVPIAERERDAREHFSMIRVTLSKADWSKTLWLPFNAYALPNEQYGIARRIVYDTESIRLPDGRRIELMYSRQSHTLPCPIALEDFALDTHAGGYTGDTTTVRDFVSHLRFKTDNGWSDPVRMSSNNPASTGGFWFFQSTWDPPVQSAGYAGMNYTGVGVGNRNGVYIQLGGTIVAVIGMMYAFYVKPIIRRRIQDQHKQARAAAGDPEYAEVLEALPVNEEVSTV
jgi:hypothetical protein